MHSQTSDGTTVPWEPPPPAEGTQGRTLPDWSPGEDMLDVGVAGTEVELLHACSKPPVHVHAPVHAPEFRNDVNSDGAGGLGETVRALQVSMSGQGNTAGNGVTGGARPLMHLHDETHASAASVAALAEALRVTPSGGGAVPPEAKRPRTLPDFGAPPVYDLTRDDRVRDEHQGTDAPPSLFRGAGPGLVVSPMLPKPTTHAVISENTSPPWVVSLQQSMQSMHLKQDSIAASVESLGRELGTHSQRLDSLQSMLQEHERFNAQASQRLQNLESVTQNMITQDQLRDLEAQIRELSYLEQRVKEIQSQVRVSANQPHTPRSSTNPRDAEMDLQIVVGAWKEAPRWAAEKETRSLFHECGLHEDIKELWCPGARTNFVRVSLRFPAHCLSLPDKRRFQLQALDRLKQDKWTSSVPGSQGGFLWISRHRSVEERHKIRAILQCKDFVEAYRKQYPAKALPPAEFDWRGRVYVGKVQLLVAPDTPREFRLYPQHEHDVSLTDFRGTCTGWLVSTNAFSQLAGVQPHELPQLWSDLLPQGKS